ncbi:dTDP-glucose 4,6-dehydratase/UDP-glucuronate decarboxylase [Ruminiclostridium sufflavum DSM 19573]|uniref:dTDP-glucose 4,6-dehydratase/UDP-glucuronate decarboxylase n=1 Tax=Ruminiclostridium sufflavum DSM 19573 TaxID=1121337 RepID=A0A318XJI7_9FIRM|nr:NAD-dependent epimerase/dehydratase family protein [Ruminiclostridium sufflavum]PYG84999.1 dTDP-glucose 4,6-dehydratase/UDP-glucuronate decarboxylase [Ruminiclostridium sufflavum DSM 19573]
MDKIIEQDCLEYIKKINLKPLYGKTILVTGANGLIGTYLIYMLHLANITEGAEINIIGISKSAPCDALQDIFSGRNRFVSADLIKMDYNALQQRADYIVHGATYAQPGKFLRNYLDTIHLNISSTEKLLQKAKKDGARFLYLSSSEVYGEPDNDNIPTKEIYPGLCSSIGIRAIYSESKRMGETLCFTYKNLEEVDAKIARIAMTYGPGVKLDDERVMAQFMKQALNEKKIVMLDEGNKVRTFCYIADCVLMLLNILMYSTDFVYNVGGKDRISIKRLAEEVCALTGSTLSVEKQRQLTDKDIKVSPERIELDTEKICKEFGLEPFKPFKEGLTRTIVWNVLRSKGL